MLNSGQITNKKDNSLLSKPKDLFGGKNCYLIKFATESNRLYMSPKVKMCFTYTFYMLFGFYLPIYHGDVLQIPYSVQRLNKLHII